MPWQSLPGLSIPLAAWTNGTIGWMPGAVYIGVVPIISRIFPIDGKSRIISAEMQERTPNMQCVDPGNTPQAIVIQTNR